MSVCSQLDTAGHAFIVASDLEGWCAVPTEGPCSPAAALAAALDTAESIAGLCCSILRYIAGRAHSCWWHCCCNSATSSNQWQPERVQKKHHTPKQSQCM